MGNQQLYDLLNDLGITNQELQLGLSLFLGDGCFARDNVKEESYIVSTSSINKDYLEYKLSLLSNIKSSGVKKSENNGYKKGIIYKMSFFKHKAFDKIHNMPLEMKLDLLDELGFALWMYDDGSLHKEKLFYNLNTHAFSVEDQLLMLEKLKKFNIEGKILKEKKKDGRVFFYITFSKYKGCDCISNIMSKVKVDSMKYKLWSSTTIQQWSTFQEEWKSKGVDDFVKFKSFMVKRFRESTQDIV
jgi:hypothetical protein